jgi:hypothetical protein
MILDFAHMSRNRKANQVVDLVRLDDDADLRLDGKTISTP